MPPAVEIPPPVRVKLAHAAVQAVARRAGVDTLLVKGCATDPRLYYPGRSSSDVDVLVRPCHVDRMVGALEATGWSTVTTFRSGSLFRHAQTMRHPAWGLVDAHRCFPGFDAAPEDTFQALWRERTVMPVAQYPCDVPHLVDQALLIMVHAARSAEKIHHDMDHLRRALSTADWRAVEERARELHAHMAFSAALGRLDPYRDHPSHDLWAVLSRGGTRSQEWRARMRAATTLRGKARIVAASPLPNLDHLRMDLGHEPTIPQIVMATVSRPLQAAREFILGGARLDTATMIDSISEQLAPQRPRPVASHRPVEPGEEPPGIFTGPADVTASRDAAGTAPTDPASSAGVLRPGPRVAVVEDADPGTQVMDSPVFLSQVPESPPWVLEGPAAVIWRAARTVPEDDVVDRVAQATGLEQHEVAGDVLAFLERLRSEDILRDF